MKKMLLVVAIATLWAGNAQSQADCGTAEMDTTEFFQLPWYKNMDYLPAFLDSIGYNTGSSRIIEGGIKYWIPVQLWVYRHSNGTCGPTQPNLQYMMDVLNNIYNVQNNTTIAFYSRCQVNYVNDDNLFDMNTNGCPGLANNNKVAGAINVHIFNSLADGSHPLNGVYFSNRKEAVFVTALATSATNNAGGPSTLAHEIGHALGLQHTHQYYDQPNTRLREYIDRNITDGTYYLATYTGDALFDTPADPELSPNYNCNYVIGGTDLSGASYANPPTNTGYYTSYPPDTRNVMSYNGVRPCRNHFSLQQIGVMLYQLYRGNFKTYKDWWNDPKARFDSYEPDNTVQMSRELALNEVQEHSFHQQHEIVSNGSNGPFEWSQCDADWVVYNSQCNATLTVQTAALPGRANANTRLTLFDLNMNQVAQNDDISSGNQYSAITYNFVAGQPYFIRVDNILPPAYITGFYSLNIGGTIPEITGAYRFCGQTTYTLAGLSNIYTVNWSSSNPAVAQIAGNGNTATASSVSTTGFFNVEAAITLCPASNPVILRSKDVEVGLEASDATLTFSPALPIPNPHYCVNTSFSVSTRPLLSATDYQWTTSGNLQITSGQGTPYLQVTANTVGSASISLTILTPCGNITTQRVFSIGSVFPITKNDDKIITATAGCISYTGTVTCLAVSGATSYDWTIQEYDGNRNPLAYSTYNTPGNTLNYTAVYANPALIRAATVTVRANTSCGGTGWASETFYSCRNYRTANTVEAVDLTNESETSSIQFFPNPAKGFTTVKILSPGKKTAIHKIEVADRSGLIIKRTSMNPNQTEMKINLAGIRPDVYTVRVYDGKQWLTGKLIIL